MGFICFFFTRPIFRDMVDAVITVEDEEIVNAMRMCYERLKVVVEPSGLAAVLSEQFEMEASKGTLQHVGIVLSGGNVDLAALSSFFQDI